MKLLPARRLRDEAAVARFEREIKAIGRLDHPAIVRATDAGVVDGAQFLAMDYIEGIDLSKLVRLNGPLDVASACEVIRQAALGLQHAHEQDLIHRDVKPSNLMLDRRGEVRILDLGLALFGAASEAVDELTTVGQLMGTLDYMAPEQGDNSHDVDGRADVYSLGATLFKLLTGTAPYESDERRTPLAKMKALATIDAPSLGDRSEDLPLELIETVNRMLSRDVEDRFATAAEVAAVLEPFCAEHKLIELADRGRSLASAAEANNEPVFPATIPPFVRPGGNSHAESGDAPTARSAAATWLRWLMLPLILAAGVVIWLETDNGTIHIQCADKNVPIEIRRGDEVVRKETLSIGKNELTVRSGRYEIELPKTYDSLKVEDGRIQLKRGGDVYVSITHIERPVAGGPGVGTPDISPPGMGAAGAFPGTLQPQPVFSGKTFDQWKQEVLTERNPEELEIAVNALCILGRGYRDREAAEAVLQILEPYPLDSLPRRVKIPVVDNEEKLVASAIRQLRRLRTGQILEPIVAALQKDSALLRRLIIEWLAQPPHGVHQDLSASLVGTPDPLREALLTSPDYIDTVLKLWNELDESSQYFAFEGLSDQVRGPRTEPKFVARLEELVGTPTSPFHLKATRLMADINPRPELVDLFLNALEDPENVSHFVHDAWWSNESDAWLGLARLGQHAVASAERIAALLESSEQQSYLDQAAVITVPFSVRQPATQILSTRRLLIYELLGRMGPDVPESVTTAIVASMGDPFGAAPDFEGDYGFEAVRPEFLIDGGKLTARLVDLQEIRGMRAELTGSSLNAAVLALQIITGAPVPYAEMPFLRLAPAPGESGALDSGFGGRVAAGSSADQISVSFLPKLVTYQGRRFHEWCAAAENLAGEDTPLEQLDSIRAGVMLLRTSGPGQQAATSALARMLQHVLSTQTLYVDGQANTVPSDMAMTAYDALKTNDSNVAILAAVTTLRRGSDQARWWVVDRLANARTETGHSLWSYDSELSTSLNRSTDFTVAFFEQFEKLAWAGHSAGLKRALLRLAWRFVTTDGRARQSSLDSSYMEGLLDDDDPFVRAEAAVIMSRLSLTLNQAIGAELRSRLVDVLMSAIEQTPEGVEVTDLVVALPEMTAKLRDSTAERILALIRKDSAAEKGPRPFLMQLMSHSPRSPGGDFGASDYAVPDDTAGQGSPGGIPRSTPNWQLVTSRRLLLLYALTANPPSAADVRNEIGEALAKLVPLPIRSFSEGQGPLKDLRFRWIEGHRVIGSQPADAEMEAELFVDAVVGVAMKWLPQERAREILFPQNPGDGK